MKNYLGQKGIVRPVRFHVISRIQFCNHVIKANKKNLNLYVTMAPPRIKNASSYFSAVSKVTILPLGLTLILFQGAE